MIKIRNLCFSFEGRSLPALNHISTDIQPGERIAIVGSNASGKTTLARCLNGLLLPASGYVKVDELDTRDRDSLSAIRRIIGIVFQNPDDQLVTTSVEYEIAFGLENIGVPTPTMHHRVNEILERFALTRYRHHPPHLLSGGEKQRLAIASNVALKPQYLVLDEPTSMLDSAGQFQVLDVIDELSTREQIATIQITQNVEEAARADRVIVMEQGRIVLDGSPSSVFSDPNRMQSIGLEIPFLFALENSLPENSTSSQLSLDDLSECVVQIAKTQSKSQSDLCRDNDNAHNNATQRATLRVENVYHSYKLENATIIPALVDVTADLSTGGAIGIIGSSGSGKSTLAQHLNGLLSPQSGRVLLDGHDLATTPNETQSRRRVGLVFQYPEIQLFEETVAEDVAFGPRNIGCGEAEIEERVNNALNAVALPGEQFGSRQPTALSGGERRRAAIAGVLAMDPDVLIMDEPTAGLDPMGFTLLVNLLNSLRKKGTLVVLVTHDVRLVAAATSRVIALADGRITMEGKTDVILADPNFNQLTGLQSPPHAQLVHLLQQSEISVPKNLLTQQQVLDFVTCLTKNDRND